MTVDSVLWRFINLSNFKAMYDLNRSEGGKSQVDIRLSRKDCVTDFFDISADSVNQGEVYHIDLIGVRGIPSSHGSIPLEKNPGRGEWRIPNQHSPEKKYELWKPEYGFPTPEQIKWEDAEKYYEGDPPIIYFVKDIDNQFYARAVPDTTREALNDYPGILSEPWKDSRRAKENNNFGVVHFDSDTRNKQ
ncbi:hypothetical protein [Salinigranum sp. GCM10025319]|uniref:hypothetical protein n=1 Tax=Salinigranum sp. GCM10025319 TaxID=3252687 RepID=UPI00360ED040